MKKLIVLVFALVLLLPLAGCDSQVIKIGVVLPDASEERWANQDGRFFEDELDALGDGYEYEILFSEGDEAKEKTNVDALIAKGAEVIIITAEGSGAGAAQAANEAGVTLIAHDRMAMKDDETKADFYTTFNSWEVGKAQGGHLVEMAIENGCSESNPCDLAIFAGRVADWPNATYFFGGAMEEIQPEFDMFNIINVDDTFTDLDFYTEDTFDDDAKDALQQAMLPVDTDWNAQTAATKASALVATLDDADKSNEDVYVLAPNDDTSAAIRQEFAKMSDPYDNYYTTGQDASNVALASLMGDPIKGKGTQTMTVFKDTSKLCADSVAIAKNVIDGNPGLEGLNAGPKINDVDTAYTEIDTLTYDNPQATYDLIFATEYKDEDDDTFSNIDFSQYK
ncbi:MAG: substrate-binding domain-containing protein [Candidatus Izemoplasmatales bacterium]